MDINKQLFLALCLFLSYALGTDYKRVCYFAGWSTKRQNSAARFDLDNLDPFLCTHIVYAFANIDVAKLTLIPAEWDDESTTKNAGSFERLNGLKSKNKGLKTLLSIGGAHAGSNAFEAVVKTPASIRTFVRNALQYVKSWGFDGIDIDWEYPSVKVRHSFTNLLKAFRLTIDSQKGTRLLLTVAVGVSEKEIIYSYDVPAMARAVDFISVMAYDIHGPWNSYVGLNSPLFSRNVLNNRFDYRLSQEWAMKRYIQAGAPSRKLLLGMATKGRSFTLADASKTTIGSPITGPGPPGELLREKGIMSYIEMCQFLDGDANRQWDDTQKAPYAYKGTTWVGYDNRRSLAIKASWLVRNNLGGAMIWSLDMDDSDGTYCGTGKYPLISTVKNVLEGRSKVIWSASSEVARSTTLIGLICIIRILNSLYQRL